MAKDKVIEFLKTVDGNAELQERLERALDDEGKAVESFLAAAADQGFEFTADEFLEALPAELPDGERGEMSDDALEAVAGGLVLSSRGMWGMAHKAKKVFGSYRAGLGIRNIGPGGFDRLADEEESGEP
jgi:predicted ribosomally synthesized peptide with nif11-like leader